jgi:hypothetical protein
VSIVSTSDVFFALVSVCGVRLLFGCVLWMDFLGGFCQGLAFCVLEGLFVFVGEFDPGSGRTLAVCLTHASRAERPLWGCSSGERVSNT